jgi:hypothetical protein
VRTTKGDHRFAIPAGFIKLGKHQTYASSQQLLKALKQLIPLKLSDLWVIRHPSCHQKIKQLESKLVRAALLCLARALLALSAAHAAAHVYPIGPHCAVLQPAQVRHPVRS